MSTKQQYSKAQFLLLLFQSWESNNGRIFFQEQLTSQQLYIKGIMNKYKWEELIPLREKDAGQYKPTQQQIIEYADYIGLELPADKHLIYIAKQGINAQLPDEWQACQSLDGEMLYRNKISKLIQQEHPLDQYYRQQVILKKINQSAQFYDGQESANQYNQSLHPIQEQKNELSQSANSDNYDKKYSTLNAQYLMSKNAKIKQGSLLSEMEQGQSEQYSELNRNIASSNDIFSSKNILSSKKLDSLFKTQSNNLRMNDWLDQQPYSLNLQNGHKITNTSMNKQKQRQESVFNSRLPEQVPSHQGITVKNQFQTYTIGQIYIQPNNKLLTSLEALLREKDIKNTLLDQIKSNNCFKLQYIKLKIASNSFKNKQNNIVKTNKHEQNKQKQKKQKNQRQKPDLNRKQSLRTNKCSKDLQQTQFNYKKYNFDDLLF